MLNLRYWDDPVLSTVCEPVRDSEFGSKLEDFGRELISTMVDHNGVGLAAPQVGVSTRIFAMHFPKGGVSLSPIAVCNPTLQFSGPIVLLQEGCLSVPEVFEQVARSQFATMRYFTLLGEEREVEIRDMDARIAAHEIDHLDGIMFFDRRRMSRQMSKALLRKWDKIKYQYVEQ